MGGGCWRKAWRSLALALLELLRGTWICWAAAAATASVCGIGASCVSLCHSEAVDDFSKYLEHKRVLHQLEIINRVSDQFAQSATSNSFILLAKASQSVFCLQLELKQDLTEEY